MRLVCTNCFQDKIARKFIRDNGAIGECDFCGSKTRKVLPPHQLRALFKEVLNLYRCYEPMSSEVGSWGGRSLAECMAEWEIFDEDSTSTANHILDEIRGYDPHDDDLSASDEWEAKSDHWSVTPGHQLWPWFAEHLKRERRFVIEECSGEIVRPEKWVPDLIHDADAIFQLGTSKRLFRGRIGSVGGTPPWGGDRQPIPPDSMGAPPPRLARGGRANPEGFSYLYCALEPETAIIETGRFPGAVVSLYQFRARKPLRLADLRDKHSIIEPLGTPNLAEVVKNSTLLGSLGRALGEPIHPEDSNIEYLPTQYLAEVIRSEGYDGICYSSALNQEGTNVVIFDPSSVRVLRTGQIFELGRAEYTIHPRPEA